MHELSISEYIDASPETVWAVMADRQEEWWCPAPWTTEIVEQDRRAGGRCAMVMHGPDGEEMPSDGLYLAWEEGKRFVTTDAINGALEPATPFMIGTWEIAPEGDGTRYTASARHWSAEDCARHKDMGFEEGWSACAAQLKALCEA